MKYGILFATVAVLLVMLPVSQRGWQILLLWPAVSFGIVSLGYLRLGPRVYGKSERGLLSPMTQLVLLPYLLYLWAVWYAVRIVKREPAFNTLTENISIGRRLLSRELPNDIDHVVDLTCEFNEPKALRSLTYHSFQILDGFVPSSGQLHEWSDRISKLSGNIYIHCAEGHGRTGLMAAGVLLHLGHSQTPDEALQFIRSKRPLVRLGQRQLAVLNEMHKLAEQCGERANWKWFEDERGEIPPE
ncbi:MAG: dual specificity protein phosphatase family protein [Planctomycetaceae bacterium]|nr:dual specificity protein phosphatase family protein [Planctomycetaceae bacterium]